MSRQHVDEVKLTHVENEIFDALRETVKHSKLQIELMTAAGWVENKLLGKDYDRIEINLGGIEVTDFVGHVMKYLASIGKKDCGVIDRDLDPSKHPATARMHLFGVRIDFFCRSSLLYNIITGKVVEDYPKRGTIITQPAGIEIAQKNLSETYVCPKGFERLIPKYMSKFVKKVTDVKGDGTCGFRSIALAIGKQQSHWLQVRKDMVKELKDNKDLYLPLFAVEGIKRNDKISGYEKMIQDLSDADDHRNDMSLEWSKWMEVPEMCLILANMYQKGIIVLSVNGCTTTFPLRGAPPQDASFLVILNCNNYHFVKVDLTDDHPVPVVSDLWKDEYLDEGARLWKTLFRERLDAFVVLTEQYEYDALNTQSNFPQQKVTQSISSANSSANTSGSTGSSIQSETQASKPKPKPNASKPIRNFLNNHDRELIAAILHYTKENGRYHHGLIRRLAAGFKVCELTIRRIMTRYEKTGNASHKKTNRCGRKVVKIDLEKVSKIPLAKRTTGRSTAQELGISRGQLQKLLDEGILRLHSSPIKPLLTPNNMKARLNFCLSMLENLHDQPRFKAMHNIVHIDETWFEVESRSKNYYLHKDEKDPHRTCKNKNYLPKAMFMVAVARPRYDSEGNETFSGKIGIFPLVTKVCAKRNSARRPAGTEETKPIVSINREVYTSLLIDQMLPALRDTWPREHRSETIYIQQDNAPCHIKDDDKDFRAAASIDGFDIHLISQPPNSPDLNILDLGLFSALKQIQKTKDTKTIDDLILAMENAYKDYPSENINKLFITLQTCMVEIMKVQGCNDYQTPHMAKDALIKKDMLPTQVNCDQELVNETLKYLGRVE